MNKTIQVKRKIATYFTRLITLVIGMLTFGILFQSYHISSSLIKQEAERTANQTANLQQRVFDFRLSLLKIHQDSSANNLELVQAIKKHSHYEIERFFKSVDQQDPDNTPDFRFLTNLSHPIWDDGSAEFYGIDEAQLSRIFNEVSPNNYWNIVKFKTEHQDVYVLARRTPIVYPDSGEVIGYLVAVFMLNDNFHLIEDLRTRSHSKNVVLAMNHEMLSNTLAGTESYHVQDIINNNLSSELKNQIFISKTHLYIDDIPTQLTIYSVQSNHNIQKLRRNFYFSAIFILLAMSIFSFVLWRWLHKRIRSEIEKLMRFTYSIADKGIEVQFEGSSIAEFDHFGRVLEHTFHRLSEQEKQFENLFNYSIVPTILWSTRSSLLRMNPAARKNFSINSKGTKDLYLELKQKLSKAIIDVGNGSGSGEAITDINHRIYRWTISPISSTHGLESILTQGQDITSIADAEKQSRIAKIEAERTAGVRADFLARMSHEVRTPLNGILGMAQLLKSHLHKEKEKEQVDVICACGEHLLAVLNDILDFSKLEYGEFQITNANFDLVETIKTVEKIYRPLCEDKNLKFVVTHPFFQPTVICSDQVRINQIIFNLLNNAVKFTEQGSISIYFQLKPTEEKYSLFYVEVKDTGIGMNDNDQTVIFEPFVQSSSKTAKEQGGTGLGLSIVKNLVEQLEGEIALESSVNFGSSFAFHIPVLLCKNEDERIPVSDDAELNFDKQPKVLLVEDNKTNAFVAKAFCDKFGLNVTWVSNGDDAIKIVTDTQFDLILMDNQLPKKDGIEVTHIIRKQLNVSTPIFACTADGSNETQQAFLDAGADFIIVKPIREVKMQQALAFFKGVYYKKEDH